MLLEAVAWSWSGKYAAMQGLGIHSLPRMWDHRAPKCQAPNSHSLASTPILLGSQDRCRCPRGFNFRWRWQGPGSSQETARKERLLLWQTGRWKQQQMCGRMVGCVIHESNLSLTMWTYLCIVTTARRPLGGSADTLHSKPRNTNDL